MSSNPQSKLTLNILVALSCEAKPLVDYYRLSKQQHTPFSYFHHRSDDRRNFNINLVVTGVGTDNMAAACGWLGALSTGDACAWLNIGAAGHASWAIGEIVRVIRSTELGANRSHYPPLVAKWPAVTVSLMSYKQPCTDYPFEQAVDMEGSAFFAVAKRFADTELVQSLKIISDNLGHSIDTLHAAQVSALIAAKVSPIDEFANSLLALVPGVTDSSDWLEPIQHLHYTVSQLQQFRDLMNKLTNVAVDGELLSEKLTNAQSMKQLLTELRTLQQRTPPNLRLPQTIT